MPNVFISYSRRDRERVIQLADALQGEGLSVWWDPNLVPGRKFRQMIAEQLAAADCVVVVWTAASLESDWVQDEAEEARQRGVLIPVMMDPVKAPAGFRQVQAADLSQWSGNAQHPEFRALVQAAQALAQMARATEPAPSPLPGEIKAQDDLALHPGDSPPDRAEPESEIPEAPPANPRTVAPIPPPHTGPTGLVGLCVRVFDAPTRRREWIAMIALTLVSVLLSFGAHITMAVSIIGCLTVGLAAPVAKACLRAGIGPAWKVVAVALSAFYLALGLLADPRPLGLLHIALLAPGTLCGNIVMIGVIALAAYAVKRPRKARAGLP